MDLTKLFEMQRKLDEHIEKEHPRKKGEDRLSKKILALKVELGELANELPEYFKFWSNKRNDYQKALEEYCDCLHFILSIGNETVKKYGKKLVINDQVVTETPFTKGKDITDQFNFVFSSVSSLYFSTFDEFYDLEDAAGIFQELLDSFIQLGEMLGFAWDEIKQGYMNKNKVNHKRQQEGY